MEKSSDTRSILSRIVKAQEFGIFIALVLIMAFISVNAENFLSMHNLYIVSRQVAFTTIVSLGVVFVIITSGIDLSIGSMMGFVGIIGGMCLEAGYSPAMSIIIALFSGAACGLINGIIVAYVNVTPFIVTLGMMSISRGAIYILTGGNSVRSIPRGFVKALSQNIGGVSIVVIICGVLAITVHCILKYTVFGRRVYAIGGNEEATRLSGIDVNKVKLMCYVIASTLAGLSGILYIARFRSAQPTTGLGVEMDAIAACVIGGTSLLGGSGTVIGIIIGASIMGVIRNGLVLMGVSSYWQQSIIGLIIVLAAIVDVLRNRKKG